MDYFRTLVSGKKKRFIDRKYNLDLSYITPRIIAMAYPGSGIETVYRNNIDQVSKFLKERHKGNYQVVNLSGKKYDNNKFDNKVSEYEWVDHHAPPLKLLFVICNEIHDYLKENDNNVVAINCRAGKGRTGTIICCYLLFSKRFEDPEDALQYYSKKRFNLGEGVTQPSQKRYVHYFAQLLKEKIYFPLVRIIKAISLNNFPSKNNDSLKPYFEIFLGNGDKIFYTNKTGYLEQKKIFSNETDLIAITDTHFALMVSGDLTIKVYNNRMLSSKKLGRISFNTAFLETDQTTMVFKLTDIDPDNLQRNKKIPKNFEIHVKFGKLCECQNRELPIKICNSCNELLSNELADWKIINFVLNNNFYNAAEDPKVMLFGTFEEDDVEQVMSSVDGEPEIHYLDDGDDNVNVGNINNTNNINSIGNIGTNTDPNLQQISPNKKKDSKEDELNSSFENECYIY